MMSKDKKNCQNRSNSKIYSSQCSSNLGRKPFDKHWNSPLIDLICKFYGTKFHGWLLLITPTQNIEIYIRIFIINYKNKIFYFTKLVVHGCVHPFSSMVDDIHVSTFTFHSMDDTYPLPFQIHLWWMKFIHQHHVSFIIAI
jgi:hypothetical protein